MRILRNLLALLGAAAGLLGPDRPPLPRVIKHNLHPFMKRCYAKVLAGGRGVRIGWLPGAARFAAAIVLAVAAALFYAHFHALDPGGVTLAMPGLLAAKQLREKRATLWEEAQGVLTKAEEEKRERLNDEERQRFDALGTEIDELKGEIDRIEAHEARQRELEESRRHTYENGEAGGGEGEGDGGRGGGESEEARDRQIADAFRAWGMYDEEPTAENLEAIRAVGATPKTFPIRLLPAMEAERVRRGADPYEVRAQTTATDAGGGATIPEGFRAVLEEALLAFGGMRQSRATILRTATGNKLPLPTLDDTGNKGARLDENAQDGEQDIAFGKGELDAYKYTSKIIRVPIELLQDSAFNFAQLVGRKLGERIARITAEEFTTGTGVNQPAGIVTGATLGRTTAAGDVDVFTYDDVVELFHSVDPAYRMAAEWMLSDLAVKVLRLIKDANNLPIWQPGLVNGAPDTLLGKPVRINQEVPAPAASAKSVLFGDMSAFFIRDVLDVMLKRLDERYAEFHQVAFVAISRHDSVLVDAGTAPIKYLQHAAA